MKIKGMTALKAEIEKHKKGIAVHREALREILDDLEQICDNADEAEEHLGYAVDVLSQYL